MKFVTKSWMETQLKNFSSRISAVFAKKSEIPKQYTLPKASDNMLGGVKTGYIANNKNYPVLMDSDGRMFVAVPWTDTNTDTDTWKANTKDQEGYVTKGSGQANKVWKTDANGNPAWRDDANTTYGAASQSATGLMSAADKKKLDGFKGIANNDTTTETGFAWDATRGKMIVDKVNELNSALKELKYIYRAYPTITIPDSCHYSIAPSPGYGPIFLFATIKTFASCNGAFSIAGIGEDYRVIGAKGTVINGLQVCYWYQDQIAI